MGTFKNNYGKLSILLIVGCISMQELPKADLALDGYKGKIKRVDSWVKYSVFDSHFIRYYSKSGHLDSLDSWDEGKYPYYHRLKFVDTPNFGKQWIEIDKSRKITGKGNREWVNKFLYVETIVDDYYKTIDSTYLDEAYRTKRIVSCLYKNDSIVNRLVERYQTSHDGFNTTVYRSEWHHANDTLKTVIAKKDKMGNPECVHNYDNGYSFDRYYKYEYYEN